MANYEFTYMMLGRLVQDCRAFYGIDENGHVAESAEHDCRFHSVKNIWGHNIACLVHEICRLWNSLPEKPEWCTQEEIQRLRTLIGLN